MKLVAEAGVGIVAAGVAKALADVVHVAGADGGTGASPLSSIKNAGLPWELGLAETQQALVRDGLRGRVRLRVDGGIKTGRDVVVAALLGADEVSFGTALLLAEGCLMVRSCHVDTCPVGIATQRPELRAKFAATPEHGRDVPAARRRGGAAATSPRSACARFDEAVGRTDLLAPPARRRRARRAARPRAAARPPAGEARPLRGRADLPESPAAASSATGSPADRLGAPARAVRDRNRDRTVGARLGGELGVAGGGARSASASYPLRRVRPARASAPSSRPGVELELDGEANDYVGKGMGGGRIVVRPPADDAGDPCLVGNTVLYGATGGELFCAGAAGERFAVRNSGATAVVEGAGSNACEYMTSGTVVDPRRLRPQPRRRA